MGRGFRCAPGWCVLVAPGIRHALRQHPSELFLPRSLRGASNRTNIGEDSLVHEQQEMENAAFKRTVDSCSLVSCATR